RLLDMFRAVKKAINRRPKILWRMLHVLFMARAITCRCLLPPGRLDPLDKSPDTDQLFFLKQAKVLGPMFKVICNGWYTTCLVGHARAQEFLQTHEETLPGIATELRSLFPKGHIRSMSGEDHRKYRRLFVEAIQATPLAFHEDAIQGLMFYKLSALARDHS